MCKYLTSFHPKVTSAENQKNPNSYSRSLSVMIDDRVVVIVLMTILSAFELVKVKEMTANRA